MRLLDSSELPKTFTYPTGFIRIIDQKLTDLDPWGILLDERLKERFAGVKLRYPKRNPIPFARRWDNDDVACFDANNPEKVYVIHDFASEGWEQRAEFESFWEWFRSAVEDMIEYEP